MEIIILGGSTQVGCQASCGEDWSSPETLALARQRTSERFGQGIRLQYLDLAQIGPDEPAQQWAQLVRDRNLLLPLLLIDGEPRISGQFDLRQLLDAIEAALEMGAR